MRRVIILLLDSFGVGAAPDAEKFGDAGANTFFHIAQACAEGKADKEGVRQGILQIPNLARYGLVAAAAQNAGCAIPVAPLATPIIGRYGCASEISHGKDTPSGHWEIAGVPVLFDWGYFPPTYPSFPANLIAKLVEEAKISGILGNKHASGTVIIDELGEEHLKTGKPIIYTSGDSVFQIACHEEAFGLERLYALCKIARKLLDPLKIGRVIARPFLGTPGHFYRTYNRHDYAIPPPAPTLLDKCITHGGQVIAVGKTADIFAHQGISKNMPAPDNMSLFATTLEAMEVSKQASIDKTLIFTNFVDFDSLYGHRRDVAGYAHALEQFDARLPELEKQLLPEDVVIITADHGCDPTWHGSDHTRECIPILAVGPSLKSGSIGRRKTFADIGQSVAHYFGFALETGTHFF